MGSGNINAIIIQEQIDKFDKAQQDYRNDTISPKAHMLDTEGLDSTLRKMEAKGIAESIQEPEVIEEKEAVE